MGIGVSLTGKRGISPAAAAAALFAAMTTPPTAPRQALITAAITALINSGVWQKLDFMQVYAAADSQAAGLNWINPATFTASAVSAPTFTADRGYNGDGIASYVDTNYNPATQGVNFVRDSANLSLWGLTAALNANLSDGWLIATIGTAITPRNGTSNFAFRINQALGTMADNVGTTGAGMFSANRDSSTTTQGYQNGVASNVTTNPNQTSIAVGSGTFKHNNPQVATFSTQQGAMLAAGGSLSAAQQTAFYNAILQYMQGVGAA